MSKFLITSALPYVFPWEQDGQGWGYANALPADLLGRFRVIDWNRWDGRP